MLGSVASALIVVLGCTAKEHLVGEGRPADQRCTDPLPAFPGAQGFGAETPGGRGGDVIEVTTLADKGPGSLREALLMEKPRIVVFRVSGTIELQSRILISDASRSFLTIAGQTGSGRCRAVAFRSRAGTSFSPTAFTTWS